MAPVKKKIAKRKTDRDKDPVTQKASASRSSKRTKLAAPAEEVGRFDDAAQPAAASAATTEVALEAPTNQDKEPEKEESKPAASAPTRPPKMSWHQRLEQLKEFKERTGNTLVPTRYKENRQLGKWVHNQREQYKLFKKDKQPGEKKKCSMTAYRVEELEKVGFVWSTQRVQRQDDDWQRRLEQLEEYKAKHGHCMVPHGFADDPSLYEWVHRQRVQHASVLKSNKEPDAKFKERMAKLESIGFSFKKQDDVWKQRFEELKKYKEEHGNCEVPTHYAPNPVLGRWVVSQRYEARKRTKGKKGIISQERLDQLNELGFNWAVGKERDRVTWKSRFDELVAFHEEHGHFNVPVDENPQLHRWCREQKSRIRLVQKNGGEDRSKRMGPDRIEAFESIGFLDDSVTV